MFLSFLFFSPHFLRRRKANIPKLSDTMWLSPTTEPLLCRFRQTAPKTNGAEKPKICTISRAKLQTISAAIL